MESVRSMASDWLAAAHLALTLEAGIIPLGAMWQPVWTSRRAALIQRVQHIDLTPYAGRRDLRYPTETAGQMHALHQTLLPPSAIHHSLYLANFTPSTIYPLPRPHDAAPDAHPVRVTGNLVVAGGEDLRVFEIREETVVRPAATSLAEPNGHGHGAGGSGSAERAAEEEAREGMEEDFYDNGPSAVRCMHRMVFA